MADVFNYEKVRETYSAMERIIEEIGDTLKDVDDKAHDYINRKDMAIYGELGGKLLSQWEEVASNFPMFKENFNNWSAIVAKSAGNYSQFERDSAVAKNS